jgi:hypothetical protein
MSVSLSNVDQTIFDEYVKKAYQAKGFMLRDTVRLRTNVQGTTVSFRKVGSIVAVEYAFNSAVIHQDPGFNKVDVNLIPYRASTLIDDLQQFLYNFDERKEDAELIAMGIGRKSDQIILDAAAASGTSNVIPAGGTGLTYEKILEVNAFFNDKAIPPDERHIVISAKAERDLMAIDQFTSNLYTNLDIVKTGSLNGNYALGMKFHVVPTMREGGLFKDGNIRHCVAWHKLAIGMATGNSITTLIERVSHLDSWQVLGKLYGGAKAVDPDGIIEIEVDETV